MSIYNEEYINYLNEHGGAHRRYANMQIDKFNNNIRKGEKFDKIYKDSNISKSVRDKALKIADKCYDKAEDIDYNELGGTFGSHSLIRKSVNKHGNDKITHSSLNNREDQIKSSRSVKNIVGAGKDNMPKNREAGTYIKAQNKIRNVKEACEYILSILDESEYNNYDLDYDFYDEEY